MPDLALCEETFVCLDLETTGLDPNSDAIIEVAAVQFRCHRHLQRFETLIDPRCPISAASIAIHHITDAMVARQPTIEQVLPQLIAFIEPHVVVGHAIGNDLAFLAAATQQHNIPCSCRSWPMIDTLRLARLYGAAPNNALETLREHFNILPTGAHRAMNDVRVNIEVFNRLIYPFKSKRELLQRLQRPILLKCMPLGKHKGRPFAEIPLPYLQWAAYQKFDQDLLFSIRSELKKRQRSPVTSGPFTAL